MVVLRGIIGHDLCRVLQRRVRRLPTPRAMFAISLCGVAYRRRRKLPVFYAIFVFAECVADTFLTERQKMRLCNPLIIIAHSI